MVEQLDKKVSKLSGQVKKAKEELGLVEAEKVVLEEKVAALEAAALRAAVEQDGRGEQLAQLRERWQLREKEWFAARMELERQVLAQSACCSPRGPAMTRLECLHA